MSDLETIRPLHDRVLVKRLDADEKQGLIFIPDTAKEVPQRGKVIAVGDWVEEVEPGYEVIFGKYSGHDLDGGYVIMPECDVLAVLEDV